MSIRVGDVGTVLEATILENGAALDISAATEMILYLRKPNRAVLEKTAIFQTDGTDGIIQYTTVEDDLSMAGHWDIQGKVTLPGGEWKSTIRGFEVEANLA